MVQPDTKHLQEVKFFVASNDGSVLLSCTTTLVLGLIQHHTSLDHLPPGASLIFSSADKQKENGSQLNIHVLSKKSDVCKESNHEGMRAKRNTSEKQISTVCLSKEQDNNCQSVQCEHMWPVKLIMTKSSHKHLVKPAMPQLSHMWPVKVLE